MTDTWAAIWVFFINDQDVRENTDAGTLALIEEDFHKRLLASRAQFSFFELPPISFVYDSKENVDSNFQGSYYLRMR